MSPATGTPPRSRTAWELTLLEQWLYARHWACALDLRPMQPVPRREIAPGVTESISLCEGPTNWWSQRERRSRLYLRRVLTGRLPPSPLPGRGNRLDDEGRRGLARFAVLVSAIVLLEAPEGPAARGIRLRLQWLARDRGLSKAVRDAARAVAKGSLRAASRGEEPRLEMALLDDAGLTWIGEGLVRAGLRSRGPLDVVSALEVAVGDAIAAGFANDASSPMDRHQMLCQITSADGAWARRLLLQACVAVLNSSDAVPFERAQLALALAGLLILGARDGETGRYRGDLHLWQAAAGAQHLPRAVSDLIAEIARFPEAAGSEPTQRMFWLAQEQVAQLNSQPDSVPDDAATAAAPSPEVGRAEGAADPPESKDPLAFVVDIDSNRRHLLVNKRRLQYATGSRGGQLTRRSDAAKLLGRILAGTLTAPPKVDTLRDLRRGLESATHGQLTVERQGDSYRLSLSVTLTEAAKQVLGVKSRARRTR